MKPILFNTDMVRAILNGTKVVTRRVVKSGKSNPKYHNRDKFYGVVDHLNNDYKNWYAGFYNDNDIFYGANGERLIDAIYFKAPYKVGDVLYVRETWCKWYCYDCGMCDGDGTCDYGKPLYDTEREEWFCYCYKANGDAEPFDNEKWKPSIHMPKEAARLFLKVTDVRVEKLRDMKPEDFIDEGITLTREQLKDNNTALYEAREIFKELWNSTLKGFNNYCSYSWYANPYVWVIEFEVTDKPKK